MSTDDERLTRDDGSEVTAQHVQQIRDEARLEAATIMAIPDRQPRAESSLIPEQRIDEDSV